MTAAAAARARSARADRVLQPAGRRRVGAAARRPDEARQTSGATEACSPTRQSTSAPRSTARMWSSTRVDRSFNLDGRRSAPNFTVPRHHHNMRVLVIVFGGEFTVEWDEDEQRNSRRVCSGEFWISDAGTPFTMTAGPDGVTYVETWPEPVARLETYWHEAAGSIAEGQLIVSRCRGRRVSRRAGRPGSRRPRSRRSACLRPGTRRPPPTR